MRSTCPSWHAISVGKVFHHSAAEPGDGPQSRSEPSWYHGEKYRHGFTPASQDLIKRLEALPKGKRPRLVRGPAFEAADAYPDGQTAAKAIETLQRLKAAGKPFFLGVGFVKPHLPFTCPQKYGDLYPPPSITLPGNYAPPNNVPAPALHTWYELQTYGGIPPAGAITDDTAKNLIRGYRACICFVDAQVGRVLQELDRLGPHEETTVVLWGGHGYHLGENGIFTKRTNFEWGTRVPLLVAGPGIQPAGQRTRALVELVDLYPTLVDLAGLPLPAHLEGTSSVPLLADPDRAWKAAAFSQYLRPGKDRVMGRSIRTDRWRYTEWRTARNESMGVELYDEHADPQENVNVAGEAAHQAVVAELKQQLRDGWKAAVPKPTGR